MLAFTGALAIYAWGAAPTVLTGDSAEIQTVSLLGGIAHPTGYPTAILAGRVFGRLLPGDRAHRITMMSAVLGAIAVALVLRLLVELGLSLPGAFAGAMLYGSTYTFWCSALRAEVYTWSISLAVLAIWRTVVALRSGRTGPILVAGFLLGLTLTGHLTFALPVAALGLALAWRLARAARRPVPALVGLAGVFVFGLTPYLYLMWADTQPQGMNYLRYVDLGVHPLGPLPPYFDSPWERVGWLITARNKLPPRLLVVTPHAFARGLFDAATQFGLFKPGPLGVLLALVGLRRHLAERGGFGGLFVASCTLAVAFAAALAAGIMTAVFLTPATLFVCLWAARGADAVIGWVAARRILGAAGGLAAASLLPLVVVLPAQGLRVYAHDHPIGRLRVEVSEEVGLTGRGLVPSMHGYREPRRYGEAVLAALPESALVIGHWSELMTLYYLRYVEGRRPDLAYQPLLFPTMMPRIASWQRLHGPAGHRFAIVSGVEEVRSYLVGLDSIAVGAGRWVYLAPTPMAGSGDPVGLAPGPGGSGAAPRDQRDQRLNPSLR